MTVEQATQLFETEAHLERVHAEREAVRGTYNPEYFCYTLGKLADPRTTLAFPDDEVRRLAPEVPRRAAAVRAPPIGALGTILAAA